MSDNFGSVVVCDFEYEVAPGDLPDVLCMVAHVLDENLRHVRTIRLWRGEFGSTPPFDVGPDSLFVAYSAWAEMTCFKVLGWKFPVHIFDQHTAYLAASNILLPYNPDEVRKKPRKRLSDACRAYGIEGWERIDKETIAKDIGNGTWREHTVRRSFSIIARKTCACRSKLLRAQVCGAAACPDRCCARPAPVELQRQSDRPDPSARHADRHGVVEFGAGEQGCGDRRIAAAIRSKLWQRVSDLHAGRRMELSSGLNNGLMHTGVAAWPRLDSGNSISTATPSA